MSMDAGQGAYFELVLGRVDHVVAIGVEAVDGLRLLPINLEATSLRVRGGRQVGKKRGEGKGQIKWRIGGRRDIPGSRGCRRCAR